MRPEAPRRQPAAFAPARRGRAATPTRADPRRAAVAAPRGGTAPAGPAASTRRGQGAAGDSQVEDDVLRPVLANPTAPRFLSIAIDGPAAAGKSTIAARLAAQCGYHVLDTGLIYRALTALALGEGVSPDDEVGLVALLARRPLRLELEPSAKRDFRVLAEEARTLGRASELGRGEQALARGASSVDLTLELRTPAVDAAVSAVSRHAAVRAALLPVQRQAADLGPLIMVGRDIGTVVLPDADLKVYLDASPEERARRRFLEAEATGHAETYDAVLDAVRQRDAKDSGRDISPLKAAADAVRISTDGLSVDEVVARIVALLVPSARGH